MMLAATMIFGAIFSHVLLDEPISVRQIAGIAVVFTGVLITVSRSGKEDAGSPEEDTGPAERL